VAHEAPMVGCARATICHRGELHIVHLSHRHSSFTLHRLHASAATWTRRPAVDTPRSLSAPRCPSPRHPRAPQRSTHWLARSLPLRIAFPSSRTRTSPPSRGRMRASYYPSQGGEASMLCHSSPAQSPLPPQPRAGHPTPTALPAHRDTPVRIPLPAKRAENENESRTRREGRIEMRCRAAPYSSRSLPRRRTPDGAQARYKWGGGRSARAGA
jgi:hypothetical protein